MTRNRPGLGRAGRSGGASDPSVPFHDRRLLGGAPDTTVTLGIRHTFALSGGGSFAVAADARYESKRLSSYNAYGEVPANTRTDLRFSYMSRSNWSVEAFADNVADEVVVVGVGPSINQIPGLYSTSVRPPRTYGVRMSLHF